VIEKRIRSATSRAKRQFAQGLANDQSKKTPLSRGFLLRQLRLYAQRLERQQRRVGIGFHRLTPGLQPFGVAFAPDLLMQTTQCHRVTQQLHTFIIVQACRPDLQGVTNPLYPQPLDRLGLTVTRRRQRARQGILLRVDRAGSEPPGSNRS
jgi:hypothetical protein